MESPLFGWELLWTIIEDTIRSPSDLIVAFVHWQMIKFSFSCLGTGDEKSIQSGDCGNECLPDDWNCEPDHYSLRYVLGTDVCNVYILTCIVLDDSTCLFNLYNASEGTVSNISLDLCEIMASSCTTNQQHKITALMPKAELLMVRVNQELIIPVAGCGSDDMSSYRKPGPDENQKHILGDSSSPPVVANWSINYGPPINMGRNPCCLATPPTCFTSPQQQQSQQQQQKQNCSLQMPQSFINPIGNMCPAEGRKRTGSGSNGGGVNRKCYPSLPITCVISPNVDQPQATVICNQSQQPMTTQRPQQFTRNMTCINPGPATVYHNQQPQLTEDVAQQQQQQNHCPDRMKCTETEHSDRDGKKSATPVEERQRRQQRAEELTDCDTEVQDRINMIWTVLHKIHEDLVPSLINRLE